ncbi:hypothetical protein J2S74_001200 [Evansella vedderi]|uniref:DUF3397 domain-containing protein n=1 Tax=Evansella vedderi TaxID=38282 RepID=A0ABT9ZRH5_9BACI|nr:DUF3397 domain-containing protein [Evansella vedderi]MDQ0253828.1 hypothetical protein [Evansella vedderi]
MGEVLVFVAATLVTIPLIGLYLVYLIAVKTTHNKIFSLKLAVDCTALLFIIAVYFIVLEIWGVKLAWLFILFFLVTGAVFTILHWRLHEDIHIQKVFKGVWRFQFFVYFCLYFLLMLYGLINRMYSLALN